MVASTFEFPRTYEEASAARPVRIVTDPQQDSETSYETEQEPMTKAESEMFELRQMIHNLAASVAIIAQAQPASNGDKRKQNWFMAAIATLTILGAGGNFVATSGMWIGNRNRDSEQIKKLEDKLETLSTWNEKLRNNMAAYGWLIDIDGSVSRVEEKQPRRR
jgi:hypothetical protein